MEGGQQSANHSYKECTIFCDAATGYLSIKHQLGFTASETITSLLAFERESAEVGVHIKGYNTDNGVYVAKEIIKKLHNSNQTLRLSGVGAHHQNGVAENAIKNISRRARIAMFHAALRWPNKFDKHLWPLAMNHAVHIHNHTPRKLEKLTPMELWTKSISNHSQLVNAHPWGCPMYILDPRLQDGFKIPRFDPRARQGVYMGASPLHASTVGLALNPHTNRISPQYHCIYDDFFETVTYDSTNPPPNWNDLAIDSYSKLDLEFDDNNSSFIDNWESNPRPPDPDPNPNTDNTQNETQINLPDYLTPTDDNNNEIPTIHDNNTNNDNNIIEIENQDNSIPKHSPNKS